MGDQDVDKTGESDSGEMTSKAISVMRLLTLKDAPSRKSMRRRLSSRLSLRRPGSQRLDARLNVLELDDLQPVTPPVQETTLQDLGLELVPLRMEFFRSDVYIVYVEHVVQDAILERTFIHREIHCLGCDEKAIARGLEAAHRFAGSLPQGENKYRTNMYVEIMGRESKQFEQYFEEFVNYFLYFDAPTRTSKSKRLIEVIPPEHQGKLARGWEVDCSVESLHGTSSFVLDLGTKVYCYQPGNRQQALVAALIAKGLPGRTAPVDGNFWKQLGASSEEEGKRMIQAKTEQRSKVGKPVKTLLYVDNDNLDDEKLRFVTIAENRPLNQTMLSKAGDDSVYILDLNGRELFLYTYNKNMIDIAKAFEIAGKYCQSVDDYPSCLSMTLIENDLFNPVFESAFEY